KSPAPSQRRIGACCSQNTSPKVRDQGRRLKRVVTAKCLMGRWSPTDPSVSGAQVNGSRIVDHSVAVAVPFDPDPDESAFPSPLPLEPSELVEVDDFDRESVT